MIEGIKSRPIYTELVPDTEGMHHVLVGEGEGAHALIRLYDSWAPYPDDGDPCYPPREIFYIARAGADHGAAITGLTHAADSIFTSRPALEQALRERLAASHMGTRLYIAGSEDFIWTIVAIAREAGMTDDEIQKEQAGTRARPVCCVHCRTRTPEVTTNIYQCPGCGLHVFVRDHFSKRLGAYQSVCVDAENPGDVPAIEEVYR